MADYTVDAVVIGAGVIGLAVARELCSAGVDTLVLERAERIGAETSSRNSEVIHAGIYYPPGSLKASLCVRGKALLYDYLASRGLPFRRCGKLIVASRAAEIPVLDALAARAKQAGVRDLRRLSSREVAELEPGVQAAQALLSPSTGIIDSHQYLLALRADLEAAGGQVVLRTPVTGGRFGSAGDHEVAVGGSSPGRLGCRLLVNAAGLQAREVWIRLAGRRRARRVPPQFYAIGHYYSYAGPAPFGRLVYPLPEPGGLGIHATLDLAGQVRFGPDVRWIDQVDYRFDDSARNRFADAIRRYYPALDADRLTPAFTGIRPKVVGPKTAAGDFVICGEGRHGIRGVVSLHGIESPGLTASLAIAERVCQELLPAALPKQ